MEPLVYILLGYANDAPAESWAVMAFADAQVAELHRQEATSASNRVIQNIKRATKIRGKSFSSAEIARFCGNNKPDPNMRFSEAGVSYRLLAAPLASGLEIVVNHSVVD